MSQDLPWSSLFKSDPKNTQYAKSSLVLELIAFTFKKMGQHRLKARVISLNKVEIWYIN